MTVKTPEFYESLSPNIRRLVRQLHEWGYETTDSGDGTNLKEGMDCAVPFPMVVIRTSDWSKGIEAEADLLWTRLEAAHIAMGKFSPTGLRKVESTYQVHGPSMLLVFNVTDKDLP